MQTSKLSKITSVAIMAVGALMFVSYLVYLPIPGVFESEQATSVGLILYGLASAGAGFMAWGLVLTKLDSAGVDRNTILKATAVGLGMLGLMRLGTAVFPHAPFDQIRYVPISEFIVFTILAVKFYKS